MPFTIPQYIRDILLSVEYNQFLVDLKKRFLLTPEQQEKFGNILKELFTEKFSAFNLESILQERLGLSSKQTHDLARALFVNVILPFPALFGNHIEYAQKTFGDIGKDIEESPTFRLLLVAMNDALREYSQSVDELEKNKEKEARDMTTLFEKELTCHFYPPDGRYKIGLNNTIIYLLNNIEDFANTLLNALYNNGEHLGKIKISVGEKIDQPPTVSNWIQDFLGFSGGTVSSIKIAQYMTDSGNIKKISERDRDAVRRLLETLSVLKNFPESFEKMSPEHWMVIPYHLPELEAKTVHSVPSQSEVLSEVPVEPKNVPVPVPSAEIEKPVADTRSAGAVSIPPAPEAPSSIPPSISPKPATLLAQITTPKEIAVSLPIAAVVDYDRVVSQILEKTAVQFSGDVTSRIKTILSSRVRNIRNSIDTGERLKAAPADGGAGLSVQDADRLLKEANTAAQAVMTGKVSEYLPVLPERSTEEKVSVSVVPAQSDSKDIRTDSGTVAKSTPDSPTTPSLPALTIKEINGVPTLVEKKNGNGKKKEVSTTKEMVPPPQAVPAESTPVILTPPPPSNLPPHLADAKPIPVTVRSMPTPSASKKPVADVKAHPRLVGVVDEIRALTIKDFRRLSQDPKEAANRIYQKIQALEKESLTKKAEAVKAWKESDVYALYLEIGQINLGIDMNALVEDRKAAKKEYLTSDEFDALLDLNEKLRF